VAKERQRGRPRKPRPPGLSGQIGAAIERHRKDRCLTAEELSEVAGIAAGTVIRVERGEHSMTIDTVLALAHALGKTGAELLADCQDWTKPPPKKGKRHAPPEV
jgi:transcriptional regulator with XRE-family HTH domain